MVQNTWIYTVLQVSTILLIGLRAEYRDYEWRQKRNTDFNGVEFDEVRDAFYLGEDFDVYAIIKDELFPGRYLITSGFSGTTIYTVDIRTQDMVLVAGQAIFEGIRQDVTFSKIQGMVTSPIDYPNNLWIVCGDCIQNFDRHDNETSHFAGQCNITGDLDGVVSQAETGVLIDIIKDPAKNVFYTYDSDSLSLKSLQQDQFFNWTLTTIYSFQEKDFAGKIARMTFNIFGNSMFISARESPVWRYKLATNEVDMFISDGLNGISSMFFVTQCIAAVIKRDGAVYSIDLSTTEETYLYSPGNSSALHCLVGDTVNGQILIGANRFIYNLSYSVDLAQNINESCDASSQLFRNTSSTVSPTTSQDNSSATENSFGTKVDFSTLTINDNMTTGFELNVTEDFTLAANFSAVDLENETGSFDYVAKKSGLANENYSLPTEDNIGVENNLLTTKFDVQSNATLVGGTGIPAINQYVINETVHNQSTQDEKIANVEQKISSSVTVATFIPSKLLSNPPPGLTATTSGLTAAPSGLTSATPGLTEAPPSLTAATPSSAAATPGLTAATSGLTAAPPSLTAATPGSAAATSGLTAAPPGLTAATFGSTAATPGSTAATTGSPAATLVLTDVRSVVSATMLTTETKTSVLSTKDGQSTSKIQITTGSVSATTTESDKIGEFGKTSDKLNNNVMTIAIISLVAVIAIGTVMAVVVRARQPHASSGGTAGGDSSNDPKHTTISISVLNNTPEQPRQVNSKLEQRKSAMSAALSAKGSIHPSERPSRMSMFSTHSKDSRHSEIPTSPVMSAMSGMSGMPGAAPMPPVMSGMQQMHPMPSRQPMTSARAPARPSSRPPARFAKTRQAKPGRQDRAPRGSVRRRI